MARCKDAKDITKLVKIAIRTMINEYKGERAMVILSDGLDSQPKATAVYGFGSSGVWSDPSVPTEVLKDVLERGKVAHYNDARAEPKVGNRKCNPALVCVPIRDGLLYCDHSKEGYFSHSLREYIKRLAKEFDERYEELTGTAAATKKTVSTPTKSSPRSAEDNERDFRVRKHNTYQWQFAVQIITVFLSVFGFGTVVWMILKF